MSVSGDQRAIYAALSGGLGNQMFQYAAGRALAARLGAGLILDCSNFTNPSHMTAVRNYALDDFQLSLSGPILHGHKLSKPVAFLKRYKLTRQFLRRQGAAALGVQIYDEPHRPFDPGLASLKAPAILRGYWQSERYFEDFSEEIRDDFQLKGGLSENSEKIASKIAGARTSVSVHLRFGDKVENPRARNRYGHVSYAYYRRAVAFIEERLAEPSYFIFSDEPETAQRFLDFCPNGVVVDGRTEPPAQDIRLMALCDHHIITNSSFSWWGAWLNPGLEKIVVAPQPWYNPVSIPESDTIDLLPPGWFRMNARE